jgi:hypothetical protein
MNSPNAGVHHINCKHRAKLSLDKNLSFFLLNAVNNAVNKKKMPKIAFKIGAIKRRFSLHGATELTPSMCILCNFDQDNDV